MCAGLPWSRPVFALLLVLLAGLLRGLVYADSGLAQPNVWTEDRKLVVRDKVRDLFYHGYNNYLRYGFPADELAPLSCAGRGPDWYNPTNNAVNDINGNFSLTLVDTLDTLVVFGDPPAFDDAVRRVIDHVSFDVDTKPQIFETNIRVLGGLLSAHTIANKSGTPFYLPWYRGELLEMAHDLGKRFLPAFQTPTGIPYARINLRHGVPKGESLESCTAGAGSLMLEFATLSRLTGDARFEKVARKAFFAVWNARSDIGLVGNQINIWTGAWIYPQMSSIGAGIDSFFEYALKWYVLSGDHEFLDVWNESYAAVMRYSRSQDGLWFRRVDLNTGNLLYYTLDSLSAFWPGLQVLAGDIENAIKSHMFFWNLWQQYSGLPEVWDINYKTATSNAFPLRPEFVESTWYLYRATRDPLYLDVGERVLNDLIKRAKVPCGLTGIADLRTNQRDDRMESFVLSETLKYLYLLFDEDNMLHTDDSNWVFTTEGHILTLGPAHLKRPSRIVREMRRGEAPQCPEYTPHGFGLAADNETPGLAVGVRSRADWDYAAQLVGGPARAANESEHWAWHAAGECVLPQVDLYTFEFIMSVDGGSVAEVLAPGPDVLEAVPGGFALHDIAGLRARVTSRLDGRGWDITKLGPYNVRTGQLVYMKDKRLLRSMRASDVLRPPAAARRAPDIAAHFSLEYDGPDAATLALPLSSLGIPDLTEVSVLAQTALFGGDPGAARAHETLRAAAPEGVTVLREAGNALGCVPFRTDYAGADAVLLVARGSCTFLEKLRHTRAAGAAGVVIVSDEDAPLQPSAEADELALAGALDDVVAIALRASEGELVTRMVETADEIGGLVRMVLERVEGAEADVGVDVDVAVERGGGAGTEAGAYMLHIQGRPLVNTRLMN